MTSCSKANGPRCAVWHFVQVSSCVSRDLPPREARALMGIVAIRAGNFPGQHGMRVGKTKLAALVEMAGEAGLRVLAGD